MVIRVHSFTFLERFKIFSMFKKYYLFIFCFYMHVSVVVCTYVPHVHAGCQGTEEGIRSSGTGVTDCCEASLWVLGIEHRTSGVQVLDPQTISLDPRIYS